MIGLLLAILAAVERLLGGQTDIESQLAAQAAAIEHLRVLIEGDTIPTSVGQPTFTPEEKP